MTDLPVIVYKDALLVPDAKAGVLKHLNAGAAWSRGGHQFYVVKHTRDATRVLWNEGHNVPAPITVSGRFDWPGRFRPMAHQIETAGFLATHDRCFCLNGMGTGKTASMIWAAEWMFINDIIDWACVVAPLSTLRRVWEDEIYRLTPMRSPAVVHGGKVRRTKALNSGKQWFIINHDGVKHELDALVDMKGRGLIIVDEFTAFKTHNSARSKALRRVTKDRKLWMASGTPTPQSPVDAYFPSKLVNPHLGMTLGRFRDAVMLKVGDFKMVPRHNAQDVVRQVMQPAILVRKEDVLDLPPVTYIRREVTLSPEQTKALKALRNEKILTTAKGDGTNRTSTAVNAAALASKVLQITQGTLIHDDGHREHYNCDARLEETLSLIREAQGKAIVFAPFKGSVELLEKALSKEFTVARVDGGVSAGKRAEHYKMFQESDEPQVLVAHPRTTSHGLTLTAADLTVWYGPTTSTETYLQANQRMNRPGQVRPMTIAHLGSIPAEWNVYNALEGNAKMQETLLDLYESYLP